MDESLKRLREAAQAGNIEALYALIQDDAEVLRRIDQMEFVDNPLHIAAAAGQAHFAMEIMNLKPSLAGKLNQGGFSPIHLALQNNQAEVVIDLLSIDKDLVRVKGRDGYTPLHIVARNGNVPLLSKFLEQCPNCILDFTFRRESALHIAAINDNLEAFKAILQWIQRNLEDDLLQKTILNFTTKDGNTVLHIAASKNQTQMIELLIKCMGVDKSITNSEGLKALDVLQQQQTQVHTETVNLLSSASRSWSLEASKFHIKLASDMAEMKTDTINVLLIVFALILTMTYQVLLSPPGGTFQAEASSNSMTNNNQNVGKSVLSLYAFLLFFIPNAIAFSLAWIITISLISVVAKSIKSYLHLLNFLMSFCYGVALASIAPNGFAVQVAGYFPAIIVLLIYYVPLYRFRKH